MFKVMGFVKLRNINIKEPPHLYNDFTALYKTGRTDKEYKFLIYDGQRAAGEIQSFKQLYETDEGKAEMIS